MGLQIKRENAMTAENHFVQLAAININEHVERKQNMSYLSWSWAVDQLMRHDPAANWQFLEPMVYPDKTMMVHCNVTAFGKTLYMFLPVMDHRNKAIVNPDAFAINKAMMRCLVKGIAVHGLGLYIYAGEDLPEDEKQERAAVKVEAKPAVKPPVPIDVSKALDAINRAADSDALNKIINHIHANKATVNSADMDIIKGQINARKQLFQDNAQA